MQEFCSCLHHRLSENLPHLTIPDRIHKNALPVPKVVTFSIRRVFLFVQSVFHCFFHCLFLLINWCHSFKNTSGILPQKILFQAPYCLLLYPFSPGTSIVIRYSKVFLTFLFQGAYHTSHARFFIIFSVRLRTSVSTSSLSFPFLRGFI